MKIRKKKDIKIIIQNLKHVIIHSKVFFILHHLFEISRQNLALSACFKHLIITVRACVKISFCNFSH